MTKRNLKSIFTGILIISTVAWRSATDKPSEKKQLVQAELQDVQGWFNAWEFIAVDLLKIEEHTPPLMLFFDSEFLYTNSNKNIANGTKIIGPSFFGKELSWTKTKHNDIIQLPSGEKLPIGLLSFAVPIETKEKESFFVMALPSLWQNAKVGSAELGDDNFYTSIFLHEFAHSQQTKNFGKQLDMISQTHHFEYNLNDDMIQNVFGKDSLYKERLESEIQVFYDAYSAKDSSDLRRLTRKGLKMYKERQQHFFVGKKEIYNELDSFFLTMEGIGQYVAFAWLTSKEGANLSAQTAIEGLRRKKNNWAQEESLALFLIYTRLCNPDLGKEMFDNKVLHITDLIEQRLE